MNIVLIGFMGCGKSTIGKALAKKMKMNFIDTDELIEQRQGMLIKDIFESFGEPRFREIEADTIKSLLEIDKHVVAVGGGAVMRDENLNNLKKIGTTIFLDAPFKKIINNLAGKFRPLVGNTIDEDKLQKLLDSRYSTYKKADITINTDNLDIQQTVEGIVHSLE